MSEYMSEEDKEKLEKIKAKENDLKILCPYCSSVFDAKMEAEIEQASYCDTCGGTYEGTIDIFCSSCSRLVYRKEVNI